VEPQEENIFLAPLSP